MRKKDFMDDLKRALDGNVSTQTFYDTVNYYEDYFTKQKSMGKTEEEICSALGSARLIAKTIIDTEAQGGGRTYGAQSYSDFSGGSYRTAGESSAKGWHVNVHDDGTTSYAYGKLDFSSTLGKVLIAIVAVLVLALVLGIIAGIAWLGFKIFIYVVIPVAVILFIVNCVIYLLGK